MRNSAQTESEAFVVNIITMIAIICIPFTSTHGSPSEKNQFIEFASLFT